MGRPPNGRTARYLVELSAPEAGWEDVDLLIQRARAANDPANDVRFVRAIFVPEDSSCLLRYEAASAGDAAAAATTIDLSVERVSEVLKTGPAEARATTS